MVDKGRRKRAVREARTRRACTFGESRDIDAPVKDGRKCSCITLDCARKETHATLLTAATLVWLPRRDDDVAARPSGVVRNGNAPRSLHLNDPYAKVLCAHCV